GNVQDRLSSPRGITARESTVLDLFDELLDFAILYNAKTAFLNAQLEMTLARGSRSLRVELRSCRISCSPGDSSSPSARGRSCAPDAGSVGRKSGIILPAVEH